MKLRKVLLGAIAVLPLTATVLLLVDVPRFSGLVAVAQTREERKAEGDMELSSIFSPVV